MSDHKQEDYLIRQGLDDENYYLLWPVSEWLVVVAIMGIFICFQHVLLGIGSAIVMLFLLIKMRNEERGSKAHLLWRFNLLKGKKGLDWAPPAHATRFDN